jgi:hypothetical protein
MPEAPVRSISGIRIGNALAPRRGHQTLAAVIVALRLGSNAGRIKLKTTSTCMGARFFAAVWLARESRVLKKLSMAALPQQSAFLLIDIVWRSQPLPPVLVASAIGNVTVPFGSKRRSRRVR